LRIRRLALRDVDGVLALQSSCPEIARWKAFDYEPVARGEMMGWVAEDEDGIAGFLVARALVHETEILNLAVRLAARRRGIGSKLLAEAVNWSRSLRAERTLLEVRTSNLAARKFYEHHGFRAVGRRPGYYATPAEDAVLLDLPL
jgi:[ribosomal protein S18]-alanine N-acetyltransferase